MVGRNLRVSTGCIAREESPLRLTGGRPTRNLIGASVDDWLPSFLGTVGQVRGDPSSTRAEPGWCEDAGEGAATVGEDMRRELAETAQQKREMVKQWD